MQEVLSLLPLGFAASAISIGIIVYGAVTAIGRNPEAAQKVTTLAIMGMAFAEAIAIYALVITLVAKFV